METEKKEGKIWHNEHHIHKKNISKKINIENIFIGLTIILGITLIINIFLTYNISSGFKNAAEALREKMKPAKIELAIIKNSKCSDCFDISPIVSYIKSANVNVTKETSFEFDSKQGKELISKYKIQKIPTLIVTGDIDKVALEGLEKKENALILSNLKPPYTNAATGKIEGRVSLYILKDAACDKCADFTSLTTEMKKAGIRISEEKNIESSSDEGKALAKKYGIGFVPTLIISKDASAYPIMQQAWPRLGTIESDGSYVLRLVSPPYINLTTGKLRGLVNVVYLTDKSCTDCYDVNLNNQILTNPNGFAMKFDKEETIDISDSKGKELISKYNITQVPTVILSDEVSAYPSSKGMQQFFSAEKDASYVLRKLQVLGTYKDLATNQIVKAPQTSQVQ